MNLDDMQGWFAGCDVVVAGCGPSVKRNAPWMRRLAAEHWTIACNRAAIWFQPTFAVCMERAADPIWNALDPHDAMALFTHRPVAPQRGGRKRPCPPRSVNLACKDVRSFLEPHEYTRDRMNGLALNQATFYGIAVAAHLGFQTIGVAGLDLSGDRWPTDLHIEEAAYTRLRGIVERKGGRILNLSEESRLESFQRGTWDDIQPREPRPAVMT